MNHDELNSRMNQNRIRNLRSEAAKYKYQRDLATRLGIKPSYLSQLIGPNPSRAISERAARQMEKKLGLDEGCLDRGLPLVTSALAMDDGDIQEANALLIADLRALIKQSAATPEARARMCALIRRLGMEIAAHAA